MNEGDVLFECRVGCIREQKEWFWWARGYDLETFLATYEPGWLPLTNSDGSLTVGPFKTEREAKRDLDEFERAFLAQYPDLEISNAPDPRSLS